MDSTVVILLIIAIVIVIALVLATARARKQRSEGLQERFGPAYARAVATSEDQRAAEKQLQEREARREKLEIHDLEPEARERYSQQWRDTQTRFVDDPSPAVRDADSLVIIVMRERGYPVEDFEQRAADISVDHPHVVDNYRAAHRISLADEEGTATTEDLRQAMVHYRELFNDLLGEPAGRESSTEARPSAQLDRDDPRLEGGGASVEHVDLREERDPRSPR
jgi:FtsZ-interacting cell division protein ZipA